MNILLTGGSGMVGRNIIALAEKQGHDVSAPTREDVDLFDIEKLTQYFKNINPDVVIHCAGLVGGIQANIAAPFDFCYQNLQVGLNVIKAAYEAEVNNLINLGSSCMYPCEAPNPLIEESVLTGKLEPTNEGYAIAKVATARLGEYISAQYGVSYKTYIPCNLYGYWDKFDIDKSHMIPAVIRKIDEAITSGTTVVDIWGDGLARREFMFAEDLADFILFSLSKFEQVPSLINVGIGQDFSINDYCKAVATVVGYEGSFSYDLSKPSGMKQKLVDIQRQTSLGWSPKTDLFDGIEKTYQFYKSEVL